MAPISQVVASYWSLLMHVSKDKGLDTEQGVCFEAYLELHLRTARSLGADLDEAIEIEVAQEDFLEDTQRGDAEEAAASLPLEQRRLTRAQLGESLLELAYAWAEDVLKGVQEEQSAPRDHNARTRMQGWGAWGCRSNPSPPYVPAAAAAAAAILAPADAHHRQLTLIGSRPSAALVCVWGGVLDRRQTRARHCDEYAEGSRAGRRDERSHPHPRGHRAGPRALASQLARSRFDSCHAPPQSERRAAARCERSRLWLRCR
jgi:hypothetical protein